VSYFNTLPMIEGLHKNREVATTLAAPSCLVDLLERGEIDVALGPVIDSQRTAQPVTLLPCGMIGSNGAAMTVRLCSAVPLDEITTLHADTESHTSVILAQLILHHVYGRQPHIVSFDARQRLEDASGNGADESSWPETVLMIGDKVVWGELPAERYPYQLDLGEAWKEWTGLPFVYAVWMCRRQDEGSPAVRAALHLLDRQRRLNAHRLGWIVAERAPEHRWPVDLANSYVRDAMVYTVDRDAQEAIERFLDEAASLRLLDTRLPVRWLGGS
jgi:chorismate dehydratase